MDWQKDTQTHAHYLPVNESHCMRVQRTPAGDYSITAENLSLGYGGEVEYAPCLSDAKRAAESAISSDTWRRLAPDECECPECARSYGPHYSGPCEH